MSRPIATKLASSIHMDEFPVATKESLAKLDVLKKEILASDYGDDKQAAGLVKFTPEVKVSDHKELEHHHVSYQAKICPRCSTIFLNLERAIASPAVYERTVLVEKSTNCDLL